MAKTSFRQVLQLIAIQLPAEKKNTTVKVDII